MFEHEKRVEIERRVLRAGDDRAQAGLPQADPTTLRLIVADELERELEKRRRVTPVPARPTASRVASPAGRDAKPLATAKPPPQSYLTLERARALAIIAAAPAGAEAERDDAIASGASIETFRDILAGRAILNAMKASNQRTGPVGRTAEHCRV